MASNTSKSVSMITQLHRSDTGTVSPSVVPDNGNVNVAPDDRLIKADEQSGRRLRNLLLIGNVVAWIVIIFAARAFLF